MNNDLTTLQQLTTALDETTRALGAVSTPAQAAALVVDAVIDLLQAEVVCLTQINVAGNPKILAARDAARQDVAEAQLTTALDTIREVGKSGTPVLNGEQICIPTQSHNTIIGALHANRSTHFTQNDLDLLTAFMGQAVLMIEIIQMQTNLKKAEVAQADFISHVSHELRLPMTSIKGYADLMRGGMAGELNPQQIEFLDVITNNVGRMRALITNLADISKLETNRIKPEMAAVIILTCVAEAVSGMQLTFEKRKQTFTLDIPKGLPKIHTDHAWAARIITNLAINASMYTPEGGAITIRATNNNDTIQIATIDTGIGIRDEDKPRIFEQFFRSEVQEVRDHQGWGLSLHLSKHLAEALGGDLTFTSTADQGTTFTLTLPQAT